MFLPIPVQEDAPSLEPLTRRRRASPQFTPDSVPAAVIGTALRFSVEASPGSNFELGRDAARRATALAQTTPPRRDHSWSRRTTPSFPNPSHRVAISRKSSPAPNIPAGPSNPSPFSAP